MGRRAAAERLTRFTAGRILDDYLADDFLRSAVERQFEIIGEALSILRRKHPEDAAAIPDLPKIVAFRNILAHGYATLRDDFVWKIVQDDLPSLLILLGRLIDQAGPPGATKGD